MTREQYMILLRGELMGKMPEGELEDILRYYNEYIEEAGPEHERDVLVELGSPERLAQKILGEVPQPEAPEPGVNFDYDYQPQGVAYEPRYNGSIPSWAFIMIAVFAAITVAPVLFGLVVGLGVAGVACIAVGVWVAMGGMSTGSLGTILCLAGVGIMAVALGMLLIFVGASIGQGVVKAVRTWGGYLWNKFVLGEEEPYAG